MPIWLLLAGMALLAGLVRWRRPAIAATMTLIFWVCLGGIRHHQDWSVRRADNISAYLSEQPSPVRLTGRVATAVLIDPADHGGMTPEWMQIDRSLCTLECEELSDGVAAVPVSGLLRLEVKGHLVGPEVGDRLSVVGLMSHPSPPANPGDFDYRQWLRSQSIDGVLRVDHPDHVEALSSVPNCWDRAARFRDVLRRECEWVLVSQLDSQYVPLAESLLLGDRSGLNDSTRDAFVQSGTMHILAISGMHVGIFAGLLHVGCRLLKVKPATRTVVLLTGVLGYALLTDQRPPVLRAALLATIVLAGAPLGREAKGYQSLALCGAALLLWRPTDLFDVGAQLSFLAVLAIIWAAGWQASRAHVRHERSLLVELSAWRRTVNGAVRAVADGYFVTAAIWLFTLPIAAWHFNLAAPVGLVINVVLLPVVAVKLAAGYAMLLLGLANPWLGIAPAWVFEQTLHLLLWIVHASAATPLGHLSIPSFSLWWLIGFYALLMVACGVVRISTDRRAWRGVALWTIVGLAWGLAPAAPHGLRCTFLSVGHGGSVLIELPDGRTLLYDAGCFADGRRAQRTIQSALWALGHHRLDAVLVSHADVDHFNALPGLVQTLPIGTIFAAPSFLDFEQPPVEEACNAAAACGVPICLVQSGDRLDCGDDVSVEILHPDARFRSEHDNANSLLVLIRYAGRSILLTGDLERDGLEHCLTLPMAPVDVLLSPHHGSLAANPVELGKWASPNYVVVSSGDVDHEAGLMQRYGSQATLLQTAVDGAATFWIGADGQLMVETHRMRDGA
jgi:competence protein ComEC